MSFFFLLAFTSHKEICYWSQIVSLGYGVIFRTGYNRRQGLVNRKVGYLQSVLTDAILLYAFAIYRSRFQNRMLTSTKWLLPGTIILCEIMLSSDARNELFLKISAPRENVPSWENDLFLWNFHLAGRKGTDLGIFYLHFHVLKKE